MLYAWPPPECSRSGCDATVGVEVLVGHGHQLGPEVFHLLGDHLDFALRERREVRAFPLRPQAQEIHQSPGVHRDVHRRVDVDRQDDPSRFSCDAGVQHSLVRLVRRGRLANGLVGDELHLLGVARFERVRTRPANLLQVAIRARHVEHGSERLVSPRLFVVAGDAVTHELAEDEDRCLHVERHRVVLERRTVTVAHQVVDETALSCGQLDALIFCESERLVAHGRDLCCEDDVVVGGVLTHQLHRHVAAELNILSITQGYHLLSCRM